MTDQYSEDPSVSSMLRARASVGVRSPDEKALEQLMIDESNFYNKNRNIKPISDEMRDRAYQEGRKYRIGEPFDLDGVKWHRTLRGDVIEVPK